MGLTLLLSSIFVKSSDLMDCVSRVSNTVKMRSPPAQQRVLASGIDTNQPRLQVSHEACWKARHLAAGVYQSNRHLAISRPANMTTDM